jgi:hypothetical protein
MLGGRATTRTRSTSISLRRRETALRLVHIHASRRSIMTGHIMIIALARTIVTSIIPLAPPEERRKVFIQHEIMRLTTKEKIITF